MVAVMDIATVTENDLTDLLPLVRAYCDFYDAHPSDEALLGVGRALIEDPERRGLQLIARGEDGAAAGFATLCWTWDTLAGGPVGVMNDLFVVPAARGTGLADRLIDACREHCRKRGKVRLGWLTAPDNLRAQAVYNRVGGAHEPCIEYWLEIPSRG